MIPVARLKELHGKEITAHILHNDYLISTMQVTNNFTVKDNILFLNLSRGVAPDKFNYPAGTAVDGTTVREDFEAKFSHPDWALKLIEVREDKVILEKNN